jgi:hypothetical protein
MDREPIAAAAAVVVAVVVVEDVVEEPKKKQEEEKPSQMDPWESLPWMLQTVAVVVAVLAAASEDAWARRNQIQTDPQFAADALTLLVVLAVVAVEEGTREDQMDSHPPQLDEDPKHRDSIEYHLGPMPRPWIQPSL